MATDIAGKVVLITGASTGIGAAAAHTFAKAGAKVIVHYNASKDQAAKVVADIKAAGGQAAAVGGDVMVEGDVKRIVTESLAPNRGRKDLRNNKPGERQDAHLPLAGLRMPAKFSSKTLECP